MSGFMGIVQAYKETGEWFYGHSASIYGDW